MSLLSNQAIEFRRAYNIPNDLSRRNLQKNLIVEEFKEFLEADQEMTLMHPSDRANCLKELADLVYVCAQYAENMDWDLESKHYAVSIEAICQSLVMTANLFTERTARFSKVLIINHLIYLI